MSRGGREATLAHSRRVEPICQSIIRNRQGAAWRAVLGKGSGHAAYALLARRAGGKRHQLFLTCVALVHLLRLGSHFRNRVTKHLLLLFELAFLKALPQAS